MVWEGPPVGFRVNILPLAVFVFGALIWAIILGHTWFKLEDAFITFRYSENIAAGNGFVFNPGERVLGTTTPLQTLLLALMALPFGRGAVPAVATVVMPLFGLLSGLVAYDTLTRGKVTASAATVSMILVYTSIAIIRTGIGGMETPLVLLLMVLGLWSMVCHRPIAAGVFSGLLVFCRIDGMIWSTLLLLAVLVRSRKDAGRQLLASVAVLLPWIVFASIYFGNPLPNSMLAKGVVRPGMEAALFDPERIARYLQWFASGTGVGRLSELLPLWALILVTGAWRILRESRGKLGLLVIFPPVYAFAMYFGRAPKYEWYLAPITFASLLIAGIGLHFICTGIIRPVLRNHPSVPQVVGISLVLTVAVGCCTLELPPLLSYLRMAQESEDGLRRKVGLWLRAHTPPDASVAMEAIGYQGYFSDRRVIDMAGLITPRVVGYKRRTAQNGQVFEWILRDLEPDYIILRSFEVDTNRHFNGGPLFLTTERRLWFEAHYQEAQRFVAPYPENAPLVRHLTIYRKVNG